jgi:peptidyl-prolyl cis-trans isomerase SurA
MIKAFAKFLSLMVLLAMPMTASAQQNLFSPVITVNDQAITQYEINQRVLFINLLRIPGDPTQEARKGLIEDRLRVSETRRLGIAVTPEELEVGLEEFAQRANLTAEQFTKAIGERGVAAQTFRDFVSAGLAWRSLVRAQFGPRSQVSEAEVDRALALASTQGTARVLLSEIVLPLTPQNENQQRALLQRLSDTISSPGAFASAARRYSAAPTRGRGGRLDWLFLNRIPPQLRAAVLTLQPGQVSIPVNLGPGIGIFQLRAIEEIDAETSQAAALEYATIEFPGGKTAANLAATQELANSVDTCDDLYAPVKNLPPEYFERVTLSASEVPSDIALELARLDNNEISTNLVRANGTSLTFLMLCGRTIAPPEVEEGGEEIDLRGQMRDRLFQQRIASYAESFLAELRADAIIVEK